MAGFRVHALLLLVLGLGSPCYGDVLEKALDALKKGEPEKTLSLLDQGEQSAMTRKSLSTLKLRHMKLLRLLTQSFTELSSPSPEPRRLSVLLKKLKAAETQIRFDDASFLAQCARDLPRPVRPYCRRWLKLARSKAREVSTVKEYLRATSSKDTETRALATSAIAKRLAQGRKRVRDGGALSKDQKALFQSRLLINALVEQLSTESTPKDLDSSPALETALSTNNANALHALILIETPALERLELAEQAGTTKARRAIDRIKAARLRRLRRHPQSSWDRASPAPKAPKSSPKKEKKP